MEPGLLTYNVKDWVVFGRNTFAPPFRISDALINEARLVRVIRGNSRLYAANQYVDLTGGDTLIMKSDNFVNNWASNEDGSLNQVIAFNLYADFIRHLYREQVPDWFNIEGKSTSVRL